MLSLGCHRSFLHGPGEYRPSEWLPIGLCDIDGLYRTGVDLVSLTESRCRVSILSGFVHNVLDTEYNSFLHVRVKSFKVSR